MKTTLTFIVIATLAANLSATSFKPQDSHDVESTNGNSDKASLTKDENPKIDPAFLELKAREKEEIETAITWER
jgi:hypothetical protein